MAWIKNWFSNMLPMDKPFRYQGILYYTVENFYQAMKLPKEDIANRRYIASLNPFQAKKEIKDYKYRKDWKARKLYVMEFGLRQKFKPGTSWYVKLLETHNEEIVEKNNWRDLYWGTDLDGKGDNNLGKLLMKIRKEYQDALPF